MQKIFSHLTISRKSYFVITSFIILSGLIATWFFWNYIKKDTIYVARVEVVLQQDVVFSTNTTSLLAQLKENFVHYLNINRRDFFGSNYSTFQTSDVNSHNTMYVRLYVTDKEKDVFYEEQLPEMEKFLYEKLQAFNALQLESHDGLLELLNMYETSEVKENNLMMRKLDVEMLSKYIFFKNLYASKISFRKTGLLFSEFIFILLIIVVSSMSVLTTIYIVKK
tara:strand:+ start:398 stop:1066 length:669 start_codon:yes stop_codon:yes gene_type:complete